VLIHRLLPLLALGLNLLLLGSALASDRRRHRNLVFAYLAACLAVWNFGVFGLRATQDDATALVWERMLHLGVIPIPVLFYHYVLAFLDLPRRRAALTSGYVLAGIFVSVAPTPAFLAGVRETPWGFVPEAGVLYIPFFVYFQTYLALGLVRLVAAYRRPCTSVKRNRTLLVILGVIVSLFGGGIDFLRFIRDWEWLYPAGIPTNALFALALGIAIVRYRLMDVGALVRRMVLYLVASAALAPVLFLAVYVGDVVFVRRAAEGGTANPDLGFLARDALVLLLIFTVALPLLRKLEFALARLMFQRAHGVRDALVALTKALPALADPGALARALTEGLVARIPAIHATLFVRDRSSGSYAIAHSAIADADRRPTGADRAEDLSMWLRMTRATLVVEESAVPADAYAGMRDCLADLEDNRTALVLPLFAENELVAILGIGEKVSGEVYNPAEIELLEAALQETGIALKNAGLYHELREQMEALQRAQGQLVHSAKLAALGELAAGVAHELNNPLMVILGNSGLLLRECAGDAGIERRASVVVEEATRAGKIVRDMLDFARRREPTREPVGIADVLERVLTLMQARLRTVRVDVDRGFVAALPAVAADRDQLTQVFLNLVANAIDAMPNGGRLAFEGEATMHDGAEAVAVRVRDTGSGIPDHVLPRIFEPFYTSKPEGAGTGLGLAITLGIVRDLGGTIEVESQPGIGTSMRVVLPVARPSIDVALRRKAQWAGRVWSETGDGGA
jgi:signal transduction histidine kinase